MTVLKNRKSKSVEENRECVSAAPRHFVGCQCFIFLCILIWILKTVFLKLGLCKNAIKIQIQQKIKNQRAAK